jgi:hypothetical protein
MNNETPTEDQAPERIRSLIQLQHDLRIKRGSALQSWEIEEYTKLTNEMENLRDKQIELLVAEVAALRSPASAPVSIDETPIPSGKETQQQLRKKFAMIFAEIWTTSRKDHREVSQSMIDEEMGTQEAQDWIITRMDRIPRFPTRNKAEMEREAMNILTAFKIELEEDLFPTMEQAKGDPAEYLMSMTETLLWAMDQSAHIRRHDRRGS